VARKVLVLTSGGLDSLLTLRIMERAGLDVIGVHFLTWFNIPKYTLLKDYTQGEHLFYGFRVLFVDLSQEFLNILLAPRYGYGKGANPCIDCKILFFSRARALKESFRADFVATGEVVGQRPMSQKKGTMRLIERESGLEGFLLRPLSAKLLRPTIPEEQGWVHRKELYGISGRSRNTQRALAKEFGIEEYPTPAGGCILTEKQFYIRFKDLVEHSSGIGIPGLVTLRYGRHFRLSDSSKLVIGRNQKENETLRRIQWGNVRIEPLSHPGPFALLDWKGEKGVMKKALFIVARYADYPGPPECMKTMVVIQERKKTVCYRATPDEALSQLTIVH
jgi:tRNA-specific 2-thiouridylase